MAACLIPHGESQGRIKKQICITTQQWRRVAASIIMGAMDQFSLAGDFPPASEADWRTLVAKALRAAPFEALETPLYEGFRTGPLYGKPGRRPAISGNRGWSVIQPLIDEKQFADDLAGGTSAFSVDLSACPAAAIKDDLEALIGSAEAPFFMTPGSSIADAAFLSASTRADELSGSAGFDPLTAFALSGERPADRSQLFADYVDAAFRLRERSPAFVPFLASGEAWNGAGGSATEELGFTLAAGAAYWRALLKAGMPLPEAARSIGFSLSASSDIFITIAAFRAMRLVWARALAAAGEGPNQDLLLLAKMPPRILAAYDPHVNLLRATAAAFGAAIGGAAGIEVRPFDEALGSATAFARRLARNTNLVLKHEAWLSAVADPAAGSSYVESLTGELAGRAWALFREVEAQGGLGSALESGFVAGRLRRPAEMQERAIARRRKKLTGISEFPNLSETQPASGPARPPAGRARAGGAPALTSGLALPAPGKGERFAALAAAAADGATLSELRAASRTVKDLAFAPLNAEKRDAEPFEALRRRSDIALASVGSRPPLFLATLGKPDEHRARANWVQGFFAAGGIEVIQPAGGFDTIDALVATFKQGPAPAACLCASNAVYGAMPGAAAALKEAGAVLVYLAGPASILKTLDAKDKTAIDRLIYEGCDALATLQEAQRALCVEELSEAAGLEAEEAGFEVNAEVETRSY
jgi:methylmalonyl-CoA mutase